MLYFKEDIDWPLSSLYSQSYDPELTLRYLLNKWSDSINLIGATNLDPSTLSNKYKALFLSIFTVCRSFSGVIEKVAWPKSYPSFIYWPRANLIKQLWICILLRHFLCSPSWSTTFNSFLVSICVWLKNPMVWANHHRKHLPLSSMLLNINKCQLSLAKGAPAFWILWVSWKKETSQFLKDMFWYPVGPRPLASLATALSGAVRGTWEVRDTWVSRDPEASGSLLYLSVLLTVCCSSASVESIFFLKSMMLPGLMSWEPPGCHQREELTKKWLVCEANFTVGDSETIQPSKTLEINNLMHE